MLIKDERGYKRSKLNAVKCKTVLSTGEKIEIGVALWG